MTLVSMQASHYLACADLLSDVAAELSPKVILEGDATAAIFVSPAVVFGYVQLFFQRPDHLYVQWGAIRDDYRHE